MSEFAGFREVWREGKCHGGILPCKQEQGPVYTLTSSSMRYDQQGYIASQPFYVPTVFRLIPNPEATMGQDGAKESQYQTSKSFILGGPCRASNNLSILSGKDGQARQMSADTSHSCGR